MPQRLARAKADAARALSGPTGLMLAADTVVAVGRRILPKAEAQDRRAAACACCPAAATR